MKINQKHIAAYSFSKQFRKQGYKLCRLFSKSWKKKRKKAWVEKKENIFN